ncbi:MAG: hypothetical protein WA941_16365 [Nitrososphaeraceae archaeon]
MTFKALSNIVKKHKEQPTLQSQDSQWKQEIAEAQAIISTLRTNHHKAYHEREAKWEHDHPGKRFYERSEEDNRRDCTMTSGSGTFLKEHMLASLLKLGTNLNGTQITGLDTYHILKEFTRWIPISVRQAVGFIHRQADLQSLTYWRTIAATRSSTTYGRHTKNWKQKGLYRQNDIQDK